MTYQKLLETHSGIGVVAWIGVRPRKRAAMACPTSVRVDSISGLEGDHYSGKTSRQRQVTLIQEEHLAVVEALMGRAVSPEILRRNLMVRGINLLALKGQAVRLGTAVLLITGACHPCSRMEEALGRGGYNALRGHGGVTAQILRSGIIALGDSVTPAQTDLFGD